ncbi:MAG: hypothetical protein ACKPKT_12490 [Dolichospermum sp.]
MTEIATALSGSFFYWGYYKQREELRMSEVICPLGLVGNCESTLKSGRDCINYYYCESTASVTIFLPYFYNQKLKGLFVKTTYPQVSRWINFRFWSYDYNTHPLTSDSHEELEKLGFAVAVSIPNFDQDIFNKFNPSEETDDDIPF